MKLSKIKHMVYSASLPYVPNHFPRSLIFYDLFETLTFLWFLFIKHREGSDIELAPKKRFLVFSSFLNKKSGAILF